MNTYELTTSFGRREIEADYYRLDGRSVVFHRYLPPQKCRFLFWTWEETHGWTEVVFQLTAVKDCEISVRKLDKSPAPVSV